MSDGVNGRQLAEQRLKQQRRDRTILAGSKRRAAPFIASEKRQRRSREVAWRKVERALRSGKLVKEPCEVCGALEVDAHHTNYAMPLDVKWLCRKHHGEYTHRGDRRLRQCSTD